MNKKSYPLRYQKIKFFVFFSFILVTAIFTQLLKRPLPQPGDQVLLYSTHTRDDLKRLTIKAIQSSKESIVLLVYSLRDKNVIEALKNQAKSGKKVLVVVDKHNYKSLKKDLSPLVDLHICKGAGLMHHKLLVIDQTLVLASSANCTTDALRYQGNCTLAISSPEIAEAIIKQAHHLINPKTTPTESILTTVAGQRVDLYFLPSLQAKEKIRRLLLQAKYSIFVAMYTFTSPVLCQSILYNQTKAKVVIEKSTSQGASQKTISSLAKAPYTDIAISDVSSLLHYKIAFLDEEIFITGSANWTKGAFEKNNDYVLILYSLNDAQKKKLCKMCTSIWQESKDL